MLSAVFRHLEVDKKGKDRHRRSFPTAIDASPPSRALPSLLVRGFARKRRDYREGGRLKFPPDVTGHAKDIVHTPRAVEGGASRPVSSAAPKRAGERLEDLGGRERPDGGPQGRACQVAAGALRASTEERGVSLPPQSGGEQ